MQTAVMDGGELGIRTLGSFWEHSISSQVTKTELGGIWRKITADARTPKTPCFQGFPHLFESKTQWKSESESLLRFHRVLTDFRKSLLEFLIEPSAFSPLNHAFGSALKAPVMPDCTQSHVVKCRGRNQNCRYRQKYMWKQTLVDWFFADNVVYW